MVVAHGGRPVAPHDLWTAWNLDVGLVALLVVALWAYHRGTTGRGADPAGRRRRRAFLGAIAVAAVAVVSPLEALAGVLASGHMVQHILLVLVVAPLAALSAPAGAVVRSLPVPVRQAMGRWRRGLGAVRPALGAAAHPAGAWLLHVAALWFWHASVPYDLALDHEVVHAAEHATFVVTGYLFWRVVIGPRPSVRVSPGLGVLLVFTMALQSVFLSALLTFASGPWYGYAAAAMAGWGLDPLTDQQLAGLIMWVPAGVVYLGAALALLATWVRSSEPAGDGPAPPGGGRGSSAVQMATTASISTSHRGSARPETT